MFNNLRHISFANNALQLIKTQVPHKKVNDSMLKSFLLIHQQSFSTNKSCTITRCMLVNATNKRKITSLSRLSFTRAFQSLGNENKHIIDQVRFSNENSSSKQSRSNWNILNISALSIIGSAVLFGVYNLYESSGGSFYPQVVHADSKNRNNFIADVVEKAAPAVVFLEIKGKHPLTGKPVTLSNGSGFVVRKDGIILTNAHVVANKSAVSVKLQDGSVYEGHVTAVDPITDLATVKINAKNLTVIPLGKSSDIRPGEWVIAMGSPLSLSNTVTSGIVSSVQRASKELGLRNKDMDYIQTDAVINFGNSGGPLVNLDGLAIGINTMKVTTGISFAIPSDYALTFLKKAEAMMQKGLTENGFLKRRFMGITMLTLTQNVMRDLKSNVRVPNFPDVDGGVFVYKVIPGTPAHIGGVLAGDIIIEISGRQIKSAADVYDAVEKSEILNVVVIRGQTKKTIAINTQETI